MSSESDGRLTSGFRWVALGKLSTQLITWSMTFFVLRLLDPADYGVVALSSAITILFGIIAEFGLGAAIVQAKNISRVQLGSLFGYGLLINLAIVVLLLLFAPQVKHLYSDERLPLVIQVASLQFVFSAFSLLPDGKMRRQMRFSLMAKIEFSMGIFTGLCTLVMAYLGYGYWALVISPLAGSFLRMLILNLTSGEWIAPRLSVQQTSGLLKFGGFVLLARIASQLMSQSDVLIAGVFLSKEAMGVYSVAMQLATMPVSKVMMVINQVAYPELSRMNRDEGIKTAIILSGGRLISYILFPILWGLAAVAPFVVPLLIGEKWSAAILPLQLVCLALPFRAVSTMLSTGVSAAGRSDIELWNALTGAIIFPGLFYFGAQYGVVGLAWAWLVGTPLLVVINMIRSGPVLGITIPDVLSSLWRPMVCAGLMYGVIFMLHEFGVLQPNNWIHLAMAILIGTTLYVTIFWRLDSKALSSLLAFAGIRRS